MTSENIIIVMTCYLVVAILGVVIGANHLACHLKNSYQAEVEQGISRPEDMKKSLRRPIVGFCVMCGLSLAALGVILLMAMLQV